MRARFFFHLMFCAALLLPSFTMAATSEATGLDLLTGKPASVRPSSTQKGLVVVFLSAHCPCSNNHIGLLKKISTEFSDFAFVAIHANADEPQDEAKSYFQKAALPFPVLQDHESKLANEFKALKTPHSFVLGLKGETLYQGGVTSSVLGRETDEQYLSEALADVRAGRDVKRAHGRTLGCAIAR